MDHDVPPPRSPRRGRPPRIRTATTDTTIQFSSAAIALRAKVRAALGSGTSLTLSESELEPVWGGETNRQWRLLRLHRFAHSCEADIHDGPNGGVRFSPAPREARPPHFQFVSKLMNFTSDGPAAFEGMPPVVP